LYIASIPSVVRSGDTAPIPDIANAMRAPGIKSFRRTIRFWLNYLVLACILPAAAVATFLIMRSYTQERASLERDMVATARALMQAVDAELTGIRSAIEVLALSAHLASGDLAKFHAQAQAAVRATHGNNIVLTDASGQQLVNTLKPFGEPLPLTGNPDQLRRVLETGRPIISDLFVGGVLRAPVIGVQVPVLLDGRPVYGLAMIMVPERFGDFLRRQKIPSDWVVGILDSSHTIVARSVHIDEFVGKKASPRLLRALAQASEGVLDGLTLEGVPVLSGFSRSAESGWAVAIGIPSAGLIAARWNSLAINAAAAVLVLVLGVLLARAIGARIGRSIRSLTAPAIALGSSAPIVVPPVDIQEAHELGEALVLARELITKRAAERDAAEARLATATAERDDLRRRVMQAQEEERVRLARELHDHTGQALTGAMLDLKGMESFVDEAGRERLRRVRGKMDEIGKTLHRVAWELRPAAINELGLTATLANYVSDWSGQIGIRADFHCAVPELDRLSNEVRTTMYRVLQEALTNVAKHAAESTAVSVVIERVGASLRLMIEDDGCGFRDFSKAETNGGLGLVGMRERLGLIGGELEIETSNGAGTTIYARIPLELERTGA
jgi:signal transduction histidine kinase